MSTIVLIVVVVLLGLLVLGLIIKQQRQERDLQDAFLALKNLANIQLDQAQLIDKIAMDAENNTKSMRLLQRELVEFQNAMAEFCLYVTEFIEKITKRTKKTAKAPTIPLLGKSKKGEKPN